MKANDSKPSGSHMNQLFITNLQSVSLEGLVRSKLEVLFRQQQEAQVEIQGLYDIVLEQVEKPLIELAMQASGGNQVKTAKLLGINRNTLKKKIDQYRLLTGKLTRRKKPNQKRPEVEA